MAAKDNIRGLGGKLCVVEDRSSNLWGITLKIKKKGGTRLKRMNRRSKLFEVGGGWGISMGGGEKSRTKKINDQRRFWQIKKH